MAKSVTAAFATALWLVGSNAAYVHDDPAGVAHPGCIRSDPGLVSHGIASANQSCPGAPMTDVWDFERDLYPFNLERARDEFDAFWPANNLVASNDFNVPTFEDYREPGDPPRRGSGYTHHGTKYWKYKFPWQTSTQSKSTYYFNQDIALEQINMTIIKEGPRLMEYLAENDCDTISTSTVMPRLDSAMRDDFDRSMRYRFRHSWRCRGRHHCDTLTPPETTLGYLNDELERLMRIHNRTLERAHLDAYRAEASRATGPYTFLTGKADDLDLCIDDLAMFNANVTAQVRGKYAQQQQARFLAFLRDEGYDDIVVNGKGNITGAQNLKVRFWNQNVPRLNALVENEVKARHVRDVNAAIVTWMNAKNGTLYDNVVATVATVTPNATALNELIEAQVASNWIANANALVDEWKDANAYGFVTFPGGAAVDSRTPDVDGLNAAAKTQVEADWTTRASANLTAWLATNGYAYVTDVAVRSVDEDIDALNAAAETQVEAEWVRNAQNEFYEWLTNKGYTEDVSNATASIVDVDVDVAALNRAVERALEAAHVADAQDEFQRWLTNQAYSFVTGVTIDEVNEDIDAVNAAVKTQVEQKWIADADAALQAWLAARGLDASVTAAVSSTTEDMTALNADIDAQTVDAWVASENAAMNAWLASNGYDRVTALADVALDGDDTAARSVGYPSYPASANAATLAAFEADWIAAADGSLRAWLAAKSYDGFVSASDASISSTSPNVAELNAAIERLVEQDWIAAANAELQRWLGDRGYGDVTAAVDAANENFAALNADIESQARADWINDATDELAAFLVSNGYSYVVAPSINTDSPDLNAINADIEAQVDAQWISDADAALQQWIVVQVYGSIASARVRDVRPDFDAINAAIEAAASADYMGNVNTEIDTWVEDNEYDDYFDASSDVVGSDVADLDDDVARVNAAVLGKLQAEWTETANDEFQNWLIATYGGNATRFAALSVSDFEQDFGALNADVELIARQIDPSLVTYEPFEAPVAMDDFVEFAVSEPFQYEAYAPAAAEAPAVPAFAPSRGASFGTYSAFTPSSAYPTFVPFELPNGAYPGFVAHVPAAPFPATLLAESFSRAALPAYEAFELGLTLPSYVPFALEDGPYPGFVAFTVQAFAYQTLTLTPYPRYTDFTPASYPGYTSFAMAPAFSHTPYEHLREHVFVPYALREPNHPAWWSDRYDRYWMRDPTHIDKHDMTKLFYYHKAWYYQEYSICRPTCVGTMGENTDVDTDPLAPDRVCDADDHLCPTSNTPSPVGTNNDGTWQEFNLILEARNAHIGKHPRCPVADPCRTAPPPCFYVTSECIPDVVVTTRLNNSAIRAYEDVYNNEDEKYLHEPLAVEDIVEWKLVSPRLDLPGAPKHWDYWTGLDMPAVTGRDGERYHKTCTFALVQQTPRLFESGVEYGFSVAETDSKAAEGDTASGQNSFRAPNHVYDVGHVLGDMEMWQRSFGETVSPLLDRTCSDRFARDWRNRAYAPAQQFGSVSYVWGTCAETCSALASLGLPGPASLGTQLVTHDGERRQTIKAVAVRNAQVGAKLGEERRSSSFSDPGFVVADDDARSRGAVLALIAGIVASGAFAAGRMSRKSDIGRDEAAAEKTPLLARDYASIDIPATA